MLMLIKFILVCEIFVSTFKKIFFCDHKIHGKSRFITYITLCDIFALIYVHKIINNEISAGHSWITVCVCVDASRTQCEEN